MGYSRVASTVGGYENRVDTPFTMHSNLLTVAWYIQSSLKSNDYIEYGCGRCYSLTQLTLEVLMLGNSRLIFPRLARILCSVIRYDPMPCNVVWKIQLLD